MGRRSQGKHKLVKLREIASWKQVDLAEKVTQLRQGRDSEAKRIHRSYIANIENGATKLFRPFAEDISALTGVGADWLLNDKPELPIDGDTHANGGTSPRSTIRVSVLFDGLQSGSNIRSSRTEATTSFCFATALI